jgi:hypothetical protein
LKDWRIGGNIIPSAEYSTKSKCSTTVEAIFDCRHIANAMLVAAIEFKVLAYSKSSF